LPHTTPAADRSETDKRKKPARETGAGFFMRYVDLDQNTQDEPAEYLLRNTGRSDQKAATHKQTVFKNAALRQDYFATAKNLFDQLANRPASAP